LYGTSAAEKFVMYNGCRNSTKRKYLGFISRQYEPGLEKRDYNEDVYVGRGVSLRVPTRQHLSA